jgi:hypothetical protein
LWHNQWYPRGSSVSNLSVRKLQLPHRRLKAWLLAYRVHERVGPQALQSGITQPQRRLEPFKGLRFIAALRVKRGVLVGHDITKGCFQLRDFGFRIHVLPKLVIRDCQAPLIPGKVPACFARGACTLKILECIVSEAAVCIEGLVVSAS